MVNKVYVPNAPENFQVPLYWIKWVYLQNLPVQIFILFYVFSSLLVTKYAHNLALMKIIPKTFFHVLHSLTVVARLCYAQRDSD